MRLAAAALLPVIVWGCEQGRSDPHIAQIQSLEDRLAEQGRLLSQQNARISAQARLIEELRGLEPPQRFAQLVRVRGIELERLSGGYDENRDGVPDGVVLYLRLLDADGDVIKAAGSARARLLDLSQSGDAQQVAAAEWNASQMRELWYGKLLTSHYTLRLPLGVGAATLAQRPLTAIVDFTDLLTGESFSTQKVVTLSTTTPPGPDSTGG